MTSNDEAILKVNSDVTKERESEKGGIHSKQLMYESTVYEKKFLLDEKYLIYF